MILLIVHTVLSVLLPENVLIPSVKQNLVLVKICHVGISSSKFKIQDLGSYERADLNQC